MTLRGDLSGIKRALDRMVEPPRDPLWIERLNKGARKAMEQELNFVIDQGLDALAKEGNDHGPAWSDFMAASGDFVRRIKIAGGSLGSGWLDSDLVEAVTLAEVTKRRTALRE